MLLYTNNFVFLLFTLSYVCGNDLCKLLKHCITTVRRIIIIHSLMNPSNKWPSIKTLIADFLKILHQINPLKSSFQHITHMFTDLEEEFLIIYLINKFCSLLFSRLSNLHIHTLIPIFS